MTDLTTLRQNIASQALRSDSPTMRFIWSAMVIGSVAAYIGEAYTALLALAGGTPFLLVIFSLISGKRRLPPLFASTISDEDRLIRLLDRELLDEATVKKTACIAIAIDNLDEVSEEWDSASVERAVTELAYRMNSVLRSGDEIARLSMRSFAMLISSVRAPETSAVLTLCERLEQIASDPIQLDNDVVHLTISAGFCIDARAPERTGEAMLGAAKSALDEALQNAPRAIRGFSYRTAKPIDTATSETVLAALRNGEIRPWFQPQISTDTGEITGFEALARWEHPVKGTLPPSAFLPALEAANKLEELGEVTLNHALRALVSWDKAGLYVPSVAVNFATQELRNPSLVERIKWDVDRFEVDPSRLTVEILETVISEHDDDIVTRNIRALGSQGFRIDLDDFGTGHASLSNIRRFAVDRIKIDRSFVASADTDPEQQRMIAAIIGLGERLGIETLAEGVENIGEQSILSQLGCNHLQGFVIARPMPFDETASWISEHQSSVSITPFFGKKAV